MSKMENYRLDEPIAYFQNSVVKWLNTPILLFGNRDVSCEELYQMCRAEKMPIYK